MTSTKGQSTLFIFCSFFYSGTPPLVVIDGGMDGFPPSTVTKQRMWVWGVVFFVLGGTPSPPTPDNYVVEHNINYKYIAPVSLCSGIIWLQNLFLEAKKCFLNVAWTNQKKFLKLGRTCVYKPSIYTLNHTDQKIIPSSTPSESLLRFQHQISGPAFVR